jgi:hypothetical protein
MEGLGGLGYANLDLIVASTTMTQRKSTHHPCRLRLGPRTRAHRLSYHPGPRHRLRLAAPGRARVSPPMRPHLPERGKRGQHLL